MRLLQLQLNGNDAGSIDFHPMLTVVSGLTPSGRARLVSAFAALPRAGDPGCAGLLESHGVLLDLTPQNLVLLGFTDMELDVLVRVEDIPVAEANGVDAPSGNGSRPPAGAAGPGPSDDRPLADVVPFERPAGRAAPPVEVTAEWVIDHVAEGRFDALDAARHAVASAIEAQGVFDGATAKARREFDATIEARHALEHELENAQAALSAAERGVVASTDAARKAAADLAEFAARDAALLRARIQGYENRLTQIDRSLSELAAIDVKPIEVLLEAIRHPSPTVMMPSERANELADEIVKLRRELVVVEARLDAEGFSITKAEAQLDEARAELKAAERAMAKPRLSPEDVAELEAVHERVLDAEGKASGRLGGRGGRKKLEEMLNEQQAILDRVGFPTWSAYVMGAGLLGIDPVAEQRLDRARSNVEQAEANWAVITETLEHDPEYRALLDSLESVYLEAFDLLGGDNGDDDLEVALRHLEVAVQEVTTEDLVAAMAYQFELIGLDLGETPPLEVIVMAAEALLSEAAAIVGRIDELRSERNQVRGELAVAEQELHHLELPVLDAAPEEELGEVSHEAVAEAEAHLADIEARLVVAREDEDDYRDLVDARLALADAARLAALTAERKLVAVATTIADEHGAELAPDVEAAEPEPAIDLRDDGPAFDLDKELFGDGPGPSVELVETPGLPDLASAPLASAPRDSSPLDSAPLDSARGADAAGGNRFLDILNDLPYGDDDVEEAMLDAAADVDDEALAEAEFYLLARLAAQRNLSYAGSVPLLIDDAFAVLPEDDRIHLLERLERMSSTVQVVYLTDDPAVLSWAQAAGITRAAVVQAPGAFA